MQRDGLLFFRHDLLVPLYVYRCRTCGAEIEELQKMGAAAPASPSDPSECLEEPVGDAAPTKCVLERQLTTAAHRFRADYSSDGIGGYERQGDTMIRQVPGKNSMRYSTDRSGRS